MENLLCITPIDGRYKNNVAPLVEFFSEYAYIKYRLWIEVDYLIELLKRNGKPDDYKDIKEISTDFDFQECLKIKKIEQKVNHDVKSIEYYIKDKLIEKGYSEYAPLIHFGLTSQDVNSVANMLSIKHFMEDIFISKLKEIMDSLEEMYEKWKHIPMLGRTHGQPASPTTVGKELKVFHYRLEREIKYLEQSEYRCKFGGAVGNFNAHYVAYPKTDWESFADNFASNYGLIRNKITTQISNYDEISRILDNVKRINTILLDLSTDIWSYICLHYFSQKKNNDEVGSSTMPHKVNPIHFENGEGNMILSISLLECLSRKLPVSRFQRDLSDSTLLRNLGAVFGYSFVGYKSILKGLKKIEVNEYVIYKDLSENTCVIAEGIQTILRREGCLDAYEMLKSLTYGKNMIDKETFELFIETLQISKSVKEEMKSITVFNYIGNSAN